MRAWVTTGLAGRPVAPARDRPRQNRTSGMPGISKKGLRRSPDRRPAARGLRLPQQRNAGCGRPADPGTSRPPRAACCPAAGRARDAVARVPACGPPRSTACGAQPGQGQPAPSGPGHVPRCLPHCTGVGMGRPPLAASGTGTPHCPRPAARPAAVIPDKAARQTLRACTVLLRAKRQSGAARYGTVTCMDFAYCRADSAARVAARQLDAIRAAGVAEERIYIDRPAGGRMKWEARAALLASVRPGDRISVLTLDQLGSSLRETLVLVHHLAGRGIVTRTLLSRLSSHSIGSLPRSSAGQLSPPRGLRPRNR
ncbi:recombinase family protein [Streptomyces sp. NPDC096030]|uniref:recombinase family protein n=1 Tax=Streptomyces sp. NPDC096030 TaxID=3155423 RepID=UPI003330570B